VFVRASAAIIPAIFLSACASYSTAGSSARTTAGERLGEQWPEVQETASSPEIEKLLEQPLDADRAARIALAKNPAFAAALAELGLTRASLIETTLPSNPHAEAEVRFSDDGHKAIELSVSQSLTDLVYAGWARSIGSDELEAAKLNAAGALLDLVLRARRAFFAHQADLQRVELAMTVRDAGLASMTAAHELHAVGNITDLTYYEEENLFEEAKMMLHRAEQRAFKSREELARLLGLWGTGAKLKVEPRLPDPPKTRVDVATAESTAVEKSLELEALRRRIAAVRGRAGLSRAQGWLPDLSVGVAAHRDHDDEPWEIGPRVELALPLFDRGQSEVLRARSELELLEARHAAEAITLRAAARSTATDVIAAEARVLRYRETVLPLRQRILEQTEASLNAMQIGLFQLLAAKREQVRAANEYVGELENYWQSREALDQLLRGRMVSSMENNANETMSSPERDRGGH
jgi:outer membrane protein TolC